MQISMIAMASLISSIITLMFGQYVYLRDTKGRLNRIFAVFCAVLAYWIFSEFMYRSAPNFNSASLWVKLHVAAAGWTGPIFLHFCMVFTGRDDFFKSKIKLLLFYLPSVLITILYSFTNLAITAPVIIQPVGWVFTFAKNLTLYVIAISWIRGTAALGIILCFVYYFKTTNAIKKKQAFYVGLGMTLMLIPATVTSLIVPLMSGGKPTPFFGTFGFLLTVIFMAYAISKYQFFAIDPERAAKNIVSTMADSLVLMNAQGNILSANKATEDLLHYKENELIGKPANVLFEDKGLLKFFETKNWSVKNYETHYQTKEEQTLPILFSTSVIKDQLGDIAGIVGVASDITERNIANTLQEALLKVPKKIKGIDFGYLYRSATEATKVGGDFYDLFELEENKIGIVVGDISGKGLNAATLTSLVKNTIRAYSYQRETPAEIIGRTNNVVKKAATPRTFVTVFFGILDTVTGKLVYCSAGHPIAMLKKSTNDVINLHTSSTVIGVFPNQEYYNDYEQLEKNDYLILYTDGITEARFNSEFFGEERLARLIKETEIDKAKDYPVTIFNKVMDYTHGKLIDDVVLVAVSLGASQELKEVA